MRGGVLPAREKTQCGVGLLARVGSTVGWGSSLRGREVKHGGAVLAQSESAVAVQHFLNHRANTFNLSRMAQASKMQRSHFP